MIGSGLDIVIGLLVLTIPLVALAQRANVSYPIVLVLAGLILGFVPGLPKVEMNPDLVLLIFLPPLLYWEAITAPTDVMLANTTQIATMAVGLVVVTTLAVAVIAHAVIPGLPWGVAFVLGAIVSPTDELAAVPVLEHFRLPRHLIAVIEGESLLNDATSLVIYAAAVSVVVTGTFSPGRTLADFVLAVVGSGLVGYVVGRVAVEGWQRIKDAQLQAVISIVVPFLAYLPAQRLGLSGVLAVVTAGVYVNRFTPRLLTPAARTQAIGFWNTLVFVANAVLFLIVGLQLHDVARAAFYHNSWLTVVWYAVVVNAVLIAVRFAFVMLVEYSPIGSQSEHPEPDWKHALIAAWSGLRGAVSLAAALAIPLLLPGGERFPQRDLIIFVTFSVILVTLVGGGLTLPLLVRSLHVEGGDEEREEFDRALKVSTEAALARVGQLERDGTIDAEHAAVLRRRYEHRRALQSGGRKASVRAHAQRHFDVEHDLVETQRRAILDMRDRDEIDNVVVRDLITRLDREEPEDELA